MLTIWVYNTVRLGVVWVFIVGPLGTIGQPVALQPTSKTVIVLRLVLSCSAFVGFSFLVFSLSSAGLAFALFANGVDSIEHVVTYVLYISFKILSE